MKKRYGKLLVMTTGSERRQMARRRICFDGNELGLDVTDLEAARGRPRLRLERSCRLFSEMGSGVAMVARDSVDRGVGKVRGSRATHSLQECASRPSDWLGRRTVLLVIQPSPFPPLCLNQLPYDYVGALNRKASYLDNFRLKRAKISSAMSPRNYLCPT
jgi:hypothetical protein